MVNSFVTVLQDLLFYTCILFRICILFGSTSEVKQWTTLVFGRSYLLAFLSFGVLIFWRSYLLALLSFGDRLTISSPTPIFSNLSFSFYRQRFPNYA